MCLCVYGHGELKTCNNSTSSIICVTLKCKYQIGAISGTTKRFVCIYVFAYGLHSSSLFDIIDTVHSFDWCL